MAVPRKARKIRSNSVNSGIFKWTPKRKKAAKLLSDGTKNYTEVCEEIGINADTLLEWRRHREFWQEVDKCTFENEQVTTAAIVREVLKSLRIKECYVSDDRSTHLDYLKFLKEILPAETKEDNDKMKALTDAILNSAKMIGK